MDDFDRKVYCLAGLPFDAVDLAGSTTRVRDNAENFTPCFISTPNLNFLITSLKDPAFRKSVIQSDLVLADGMPLIWVARLLGIPFPERVAGSDLFEELNGLSGSPDKKLSVFFFGGMPGVAEKACNVLNAEKKGLECAGFDCPGFGTVEEMSGPDRILRINNSGADFLIVSLGAAKGQSWIMKNKALIKVPVISHLGAVVNFVADTISRAPRWMQKTGLEWVWRIREEPALSGRYWHDGLGFLKLLFSRILPYAIWLKLNKPDVSARPGIDVSRSPTETVISLSGVISGEMEEIRSVFRAEVPAAETVTLDMGRVSYLDSAFLGVVLILLKQLECRKERLRLINTPPGLKKVFYWNDLEYLLVMP